MSKITKLNIVEGSVITVLGIGIGYALYRLEETRKLCQQINDELDYAKEHDDGEIVGTIEIVDDNLHRKYTDLDYVYQKERKMSAANSK